MLASGVAGDSGAARACTGTKRPRRPVLTVPPHSGAAVVGVTLALALVGLPLQSRALVELCPAGEGTCLRAAKSDGSAVTFYPHGSERGQWHRLTYRITALQELSIDAASGRVTVAPGRQSTNFRQCTEVNDLETANTQGGEVVCANAGSGDLADVTVTTRMEVVTQGFGMRLNDENVALVTGNAKTTIVIDGWPEPLDPTNQFRVLGKVSWEVPTDPLDMLEAGVSALPDPGAGVTITENDAGAVVRVQSDLLIDLDIVIPSQVLVCEDTTENRDNATCWRSFDNAATTTDLVTMSLVGSSVEFPSAVVLSTTWDTVSGHMKLDPVVSVQPGSLTAANLDMQFLAIAAAVILFILVSCCCYVSCRCCKCCPYAKYRKYKQEKAEGGGDEDGANGGGDNMRKSKSKKGKDDFGDSDPDAVHRISISSKDLNHRPWSDAPQEEVASGKIKVVPVGGDDDKFDPESGPGSKSRRDGSIGGTAVFVRGKSGADGDDRDASVSAPGSTASSKHTTPRGRFGLGLDMKDIGDAGSGGGVSGTATPTGAGASASKRGSRRISRGAGERNAGDTVESDREKLRRSSLDLHKTLDDAMAVLEGSGAVPAASPHIGTGGGGGGGGGARHGGGGTHGHGHGRDATGSAQRVSSYRYDPGISVATGQAGGHGGHAGGGGVGYAGAGNAGGGGGGSDWHRNSGGQAGSYRDGQRQSMHSVHSHGSMHSHGSGHGASFGGPRSNRSSFHEVAAQRSPHGGHDMGRSSLRASGARLVQRYSSHGSDTGMSPAHSRRGMGSFHSQHSTGYHAH